MKTYRAALLGCGHRGRAQGLAYKHHPRTELVAVCDLDAKRLNAVGNELGVARRYADLERMIQETKPDIVAIPTATQFHFPLAMRCLELGCHVDVEKPISEGLEQADELVARARALDLQIAVHHQWRTCPSMTAMREALEAGRIGKVRFMYASGKGYYGGYGLPNIGTHLLNHLFALAGRVRKVSGHVLTDGRAIGPEDVMQAPMGMGIMAGEDVTAMLEFENGVCAVLLQHRFERIDLSAHVVEVYGTEGRLLWRPHEAFILKSPNIPPGPNLTEWAGDNHEWEVLPMADPPGWDDELPCNRDEFGFVGLYAEALDAGTHHPCDGESGRHVLEVINAIYLSATRGRQVDLATMPRSDALREFRAEHGLDPDPGPGITGYRDFLAAEDARLGRAPI